MSSTDHSLPEHRHLPKVRASLARALRGDPAWFQHESPPEARITGAIRPNAQRVSDYYPGVGHGSRKPCHDRRDRKQPLSTDKTNNSEGGVNSC